jgi:hypothetical protein
MGSFLASLFENFHTGLDKLGFVLQFLLFSASPARKERNRSPKPTKRDQNNPRHPSPSMSKNATDYYRFPIPSQVLSPTRPLSEAPARHAPRTAPILRQIVLPQPHHPLPRKSTASRVLVSHRPPQRCNTGISTSALSASFTPIPSRGCVRKPIPLPLRALRDFVVE